MLERLAARALALLAAVLVLIPGPAPADEARRPAPVMGWTGADWLERPGRDQEQRPDEIVATMRLRDGDVVADLGAGTGYFTRRLAKAVAPAGRVLAVDIQPEMIDLLKRNVEKCGAHERGGRSRHGRRPEAARATRSTGSSSWTSTTSSSSRRRCWRGCAKPSSPRAGSRSSSTGSRGRAPCTSARRTACRRSRFSPSGSRRAFACVERHEFLPTQHFFVFERCRRPLTGDPPFSLPQSPRFLAQSGVRTQPGRRSA